MGRVFRVEHALLLLALAGCTEDEEQGPKTVTPAPPGEAYEQLSAWHLFSDGPKQTPNGRVQPYDVISPLYSDYTHKRRFIWIPEDTVIDYDDATQWSFPVGSIVIKTFSYPADFRDLEGAEQLLETRLLVHEPGGWAAHTYVWNEDQTDAVREVAGDLISTSWIDLAGQPRTNEYIVPNTNECQDCHGEVPMQHPLGPRTRQLDRDGQLETLADLGWLDTEPAAERETLVDPFGDAPESDRIRSYLDSNCGHCHTEGGTASESALLLSWGFTDPETDDPSNWGVCKVPTSAGGATCGLTFDVVPGNPDASIMMCRLGSDDPEVRMPPLVSRVPHDEGLALIRQWIEGMPPATCE
jgi:uncharacterized repeat protein (TIGR03806 family)